MNYIKHLTGFFAKVSSDHEFNPSHISIYMAVFQIWNQNRFENPICISREEIMRISKISSYSTYHKCIRDLNDKKYIIYNPSFNPYKGTTIEVVNLDFYTKPISKKEAKKLSGKIKNEQVIEQVDEQAIEHVNGQVDEQVLYKQCTSTVHVPYINNTNSINITNLEQAKKNENENEISNEFLDQKMQKENKIYAEPVKGKLRQKKEPENSKIQSAIPDLDQVKNFFLENNDSLLEAEKFFNYFQSNGWLVGGKTKMKDWKAAARNWMLNSQKFQKPTNVPKPNHLQTPIFKNYDEPL